VPGGPAWTRWPTVADVPVVPGDGRVACQHCYDRIRPGTDGVSDLWVGVESGTFCPTGVNGVVVDHKPMPRVRAAQ
jgi:hypothetical protein